MLAAAANAPGGAPQLPAPAQGADLPAMAAQVKKDLQDSVGTEIEILDVRIPRIFYDQPTQQRIDAYNCLTDQVKNGRDPAGCWGQIGGQPLVQVPR